METRQELMVYLWLTALSLVTVRIRPDVVDLTDYTQLCPYSHFCTSEPRKVDKISVSCCMPCSCSEFCWTRDDCCFDVQIPPPENVAELQDAVECVPESFKFEDGRWVGVHSVDVMYVWMISKCVEPGEYSERCTLTPNSSFTDLVPVWSPSTRDLYRNKHCAKCYDVTDYQYLPFDISDFNGYREEGENASLEVIDYLMKTTHNAIRISSTDMYTINNTGTRVSYCNLTLVSNCSQDSPSVWYSDTIKHKCEQSNTGTVYLSEFGNRKTYYKNVYCFFCNIEYQPFNNTWPMHELFGLCPTVTSLRLGGQWGEYRQRTYMNIEALSGRINRVEQTCRETEIFDVYMRKCRPLVCPELALAFEGVCYYTRGFETPLTVSFQVMVNTTLYPVDELVRNVMLEGPFLQKYYESVYFCSIETGILQNQSVLALHLREYILSFGFFNRHNSHFRNVRNVHAFVSTRLTLGYNITGVLMKGIDARTFQYAQKWNSSETWQCVGDFKVIRIWCPTIELSYTDFRYCVTHKVLPEDYEFNNPSTLAANQSAVRQICLQDYVYAWVGAMAANAGCLPVWTMSVHISVSYYLFAVGINGIL